MFRTGLDEFENKIKWGYGGDYGFKNEKSVRKENLGFWVKSDSNLINQLI